MAFAHSLHFALGLPVDMCIVFLAVGQHPEFPVVIAHNRDEYLHRACMRMELRDWYRAATGSEVTVAGDGESKVVLAGRDLQAGGTWLGLRLMPKTGVCRFATVLNITDFGEPKRLGVASRGTLPVRFLLGPEEESPADFARNLGSDSEFDDMAGCSVLCATFGGGARVEAAFARNRAGSGEVAVVPALGPGVHALCNDATLASSWGRVNRGRHLFTKALSDSHQWGGDPIPLEVMLFEKVLMDNSRPLGTVGVNLERPLFIRPGDDNFGTRSATVVLCSRHGPVYVVERSFGWVPDTGVTEVVYSSLRNQWSVAQHRQANHRVQSQRARL